MNLVKITAIFFISPPKLVKLVISQILPYILTWILYGKYIFEVSESTVSLTKKPIILTQLIITKMGSHVSEYDHRACPCSGPIPLIASICFCGANEIRRRRWNGCKMTVWVWCFHKDSTYHRRKKRRTSW